MKNTTLNLLLVLIYIERTTSCPSSCTCSTNRNGKHSVNYNNLDNDFLVDLPITTDNNTVECGKF